MATTLLLRSGTTLQAGLFTGGEGELFFDYDLKKVYIHDGTTQGGFEILTEGNINLASSGVIDGAVGQFLRTDGNGTHTFEYAAISDSLAPQNPVNGTIWFDTNTSILKMYTGSTWIAVSAGAVDLAPYYTAVQTDAAISASLASSIPTAVLTSIQDAITDGDITSPTSVQNQINSSLTTYYTAAQVDAAIVAADLNGSYYTSAQTDAAISAAISTSVATLIDEKIADGDFGAVNLLELTDVGLDGTAGQVLTTDGVGAFTFQDVAVPRYVKNVFSLLANGVTSEFTLVGHGNQTDIDAVTAVVSADGGTITISNVAADLQLVSISHHQMENFNVSVSFSVVYPELFGATTLATTVFPNAIHYTSAGGAQATTGWVTSNTSGTVTLTKSGLVANTEYIFKIGLV